MKILRAFVITLICTASVMVAFLDILATSAAHGYTKCGLGAFMLPVGLSAAWLLGRYWSNRERKAKKDKLIKFGTWQGMTMYAKGRRCK